MARHGGGAFSGKDPSKVDRSAAYAARWVAKHVVAAGAARRCEVQVAYAIGVAQPGLAHGRDVRHRDRRPREDRRARSASSSTCGRPRSSATSTCAGPIYRRTAAYGHFGRNDKEFTWEATPRVDDLPPGARPLSGGARLGVRVLPTSPAVGRRFDYSVPDRWRDAVGSGGRVRIRLHGRPVGGWVIAVDPDRRRVALKPTDRLSGSGPPPAVVALAEWAAWRWAVPASTLLRVASPAAQRLGALPARAERGQPARARRPLG